MAFSVSILSDLGRAPVFKGVVYTVQGEREGVQGEAATEGEAGHCQPLSLPSKEPSSLLLILRGSHRGQSVSEGRRATLGLSPGPLS